MYVHACVSSYFTYHSYPNSMEVKYTADGTFEDYEEEEIRKLIVVVDLQPRRALARLISAGFEYLKNRMTGNCDNQYSCKEMFRVYELAR